MELILKINGKKKTFKNKKISIGLFRRALEITEKINSKKIENDLSVLEEYHEISGLICEYFGVTKEEFEDGYFVEDGNEFYTFFFSVLGNIQSNNGKNSAEKK
ncbi:MAG: hypothetical protein LBV67_04595 [Streptococcaceae bacterium]|jgi:hypothetical protein|nr:hypothetical protein [Streptococcaceae bacterium]